MNSKISRISLAALATFAALFSTPIMAFALVSPAYYVSPTGSDSNAGTSTSAPFKTLAKANAVMGAGTTKTTYVMGGTYNQTSPLYVSAGTSWIAYPGQTPVLDGSAMSGFGNNMFSIGDVNGVTIDGLTIQNAFTPIDISNADSVVIRNNTILNTRTDHYEGAIHAYTHVTHLLVSHNLVDGSQGRGISIDSGCCTTAADTSSDNIIEYNLVYNTNTLGGPNFNDIGCDTGAIYMNDRPYLSKNNIIRNNVVKNYGTNSFGYPGCYNVVGIYLDDQQSNVTITNNIVYGTGEYGLQFHGGDHITVSNNIFHLNGVVTATGENQIGFYQSVTPNHGMGSNTFTKNIIYTTATPPSSAWSLDNGAGAIASPSDHDNLYYSPSGTLNKGDIVDSAPLNTNPLFQNPSNLAGTFYALQSTSPAITQLGFVPIDASQYGPQTSGGTPAPTVTLTANPTSITSGGSSTLTWSSTNATSCTGTGFTASGTSGSTSVSPTTSQSYAISCTGAGGTANASATVTVTTTNPPPTVTLTANPTSITSGGSSTLTWSSTNATSCTGTGFTASATSGSVSVSPAATQTYSISCTGAGGTANASATVTVTTGGGTITIGDNTILATDDTGNANEMDGSLATLSQTATIQSLSFYVPTAAGNLRLGIYDATGVSGGPGVLKAQTNSFATVTGWNTANVTAPVSLPAGNYWLVKLNDNSGLHERIAFTGSGAWIARTFSSGFQTPAPAMNRPVSHWSFYATLSTGTPAPTVTLTANPTSITSGGSSTLTWSSTNATSCTGTGFTASATSGSVSVSPAATQTYSISCTGAGGTTSKSVTVTVTVPDITAPSVPAGLGGTAISSTQINLTWTASTDNIAVTGYKVFRNGAQVGTSVTASYSDTGLAASTVYTYTVAAFDAAGNTSAQSASVNVITLGSTAPAIAVGSRVITTANLNVRSSASPSATKLGTEATGSQGTAVAGPTTASGHTWWQVNWDNGLNGWSISDYLAPATAVASPALGSVNSSAPLASTDSGSTSLLNQLMQQVQNLMSQIQTLQAGQTASVGSTY